MSHFTLDRVKETASTGGTGPFTLTGAITGFSPFVTASKMTTDGDTTWYCAVYSNEWEIGLGTRTSSTTMSRTVISNHLGTIALINFSAAPIVFGTVPAARLSSVGPSVSAYRSVSSQSISSSTWTKVQLNTELFDTSNCFDSTTNYRWTPNVAGYYQVSFTVWITAASGLTAVAAAIYKNDVDTVGASYTPPANTTSGISSGSKLIYMNGTSDYLELWAWGTGTTVAIGTTDRATFMTGYLAALPGPPMMSPPQTVGPIFSAVKNATQSLSIGNTKITFPVIEYDSNSAYNTGTSKFQPATAGYYLITANLGFNPGISGISMLMVYKNGGMVKQGPQQNSSNFGFGLSTHLYLNGTTDYVEIWCYVASAATADSNPYNCFFQASFLRG